MKCKNITFLIAGIIIFFISLYEIYFSFSSGLHLGGLLYMLMVIPSLLFSLKFFKIGYKGERFNNILFYSMIILLIGWVFYFWNEYPFAKFVSKTSFYLPAYPFIVIFWTLVILGLVGAIIGYFSKK